MEEVLRVPYDKKSLPYAKTSSSPIKELGTSRTLQSLLEAQKSQGDERDAGMDVPSSRAAFPAPVSHLQLPCSVLWVCSSPGSSAGSTESQYGKMS